MPLFWFFSQHKIYNIQTQLKISDVKKANKNRFVPFPRKPQQLKTLLNQFPLRIAVFLFRPTPACWLKNILKRNKSIKN